jgi:hypothetical protein
VKLFGVLEFVRATFVYRQDCCSLDRMLERTEPYLKQRSVNCRHMEAGDHPRGNYRILDILMCPIIFRVDDYVPFCICKSPSM